LVFNSLPSTFQRFQLSDNPSGGLRVPGSNSGHGHTMPNMPKKRDTAISFVSGSEDPHGHHAEDPRPLASTLSSSPTREEFDDDIRRQRENAHQQLSSNQALSVVTEVEFGNGTTKTVPSPSSQKWLDPLSPSSSMRGPRPLPRSGAGDIRSMWDTPGNTMRDYHEGGDLNLSRSISSEEHDRSHKHFPGGRGKRDEDDERAEEEQLLAGKGGRDDDDSYEEERRKGKSSRPF